MKVRPEYAVPDREERREIAIAMLRRVMLTRLNPSAGQDRRRVAGCTRSITKAIAKIVEANSSCETNSGDHQSSVMKPSIPISYGGSVGLIQRFLIGARFGLGGVGEAVGEKAVGG